MKRLFCFGYGYAAQALARQLSPVDLSIAGTRTAAEPSPGAELALFRGDAAAPGVRPLLAGTTHMLVSIPPDLEGDAVLRHHRDDVAALSDLAWIGYLSSIGVYGDCQGRWVDETATPHPISERSLRRLQAERQWQAFARETGKRVQVFRLAGIYGPGRSVLDTLREGTARRVVKPGQVFNRIHVEDIARVLGAAMAEPSTHDVFNVADDEPAPPQDVVCFAAALLGLPVPPAVAFDSAALSPKALTFWAENKRVRNVRMKESLRVVLAYPTYREGIRALAGR